MITAMTKDALVTHFLNHWKKWAGGICLLILVAAAFMFSDFLAKLAGYGAELPEGDKKTYSEMTPGARFFRDFIVLVVAVIGIAMAAWRAIMFDRQTKTGEERLLRERFATATELMAKEVAGKPAIASRVGGINIMDEVANAAPDIFLIQTAKTMVAYIIDNAQATAIPPLSKDKTLPDKARILGEDVKAAFRVLNNLGKTRIGTDHASSLDFSYVDFSYLDLREMHVTGLHRFKWAYADLSGANLEGADLHGANLMMARLHGTNLPMANLEGASLRGAQLQGANLASVEADASTVWDLTNLSFASLRHAHMEVRDWTAVIFYATDLSHTSIKKLTEYACNRLEGNIWHSGAEELAHIEEQSENDWNLDACGSTSALVGAFWNFAEWHRHPHLSNRAMGFIAAAIKSGLPQDFPHKWRKWLDEIKPGIQ